MKDQANTETSLGQGIDRAETIDDSFGNGGNLEHDEVCCTLQEYEDKLDVGQVVDDGKKMDDDDNGNNGDSDGDDDDDGVEADVEVVADDIDAVVDDSGEVEIADRDIESGNVIGDKDEDDEDRSLRCRCIV